jgi:hypothetical protein
VNSKKGTYCIEIERKYLHYYLTCIAVYGARHSTGSR